MNPVIEDIEVSKRLDGSKLYIRVIRFGKGSPRLLITSSMHGDEATSIAVVWKIIDFLKVADLRGSVTLIPSVNPEGLSLLRREEPYSNIDINRVYPGSERGILPERIAYIISKIALNHDVVLDIHSAGDSIPYIIIHPVEEYDLKDRLYDLAFSMGITVVENYPERIYLSRGLNRTLSRFIVDNNIPALTLELAGGRKINWLHASIGFKAVLNLMIKLMMIDITPNIITEAPVFKERGLRLHDVIVDRAGIIEEFIELGEYAEKHMDLGVLRDLSGNIIQRIKADAEGYVIRRCSKSVLYPYDIAFTLAVRGG